MTGITKGLLLHIRDAFNPEQGAKAVAVEGLDGADSRQIEGLDLGERFPHDFPPLLHQPRGPGVLGDHVNGRKDRTIFVGPLAHHREATDVAGEFRQAFEDGL